MRSCDKDHILLVISKILIIIIPILLYCVLSTEQMIPIVHLFICINILWTLFFDSGILNITQIVIVLYLLFIDSYHFYWVYLIWNVYFTAKYSKTVKKGIFYGIAHNIPASMYVAYSKSPNIITWALIRALSLLPFVSSTIIHC